MKIHGGIELDNHEHGHEVGTCTGNPYNSVCDHVVSRTIDGELVGGVIFQNYMRASIVLHVASWDRRWLSHDLLWTIFAFPFLQLGVHKCLGFVPSTNHHALEFDLRLGFVEEYRIAGAVPDGDMVVISMTKPQCRWLMGRPPKGFAKVALERCAVPSGSYVHG